MVNGVIIYDSIIYSLQKSGGISVYWKMLENCIPITKRIVYNNREKNIFYTLKDNEVCLSKIIFLERYKNLYIKEKEKFLFHSSYYRYCKSRNAINITTVHDFTYEIFNNSIKSLFHKIQKKRAVMHSDGIICISENTKHDLYKYYPNYKGKVKVIYHGYDDKIFNFKGIKHRSNNVLFVGSRVGYKAFDFTVRLLADIQSLNLKIIGGGDLSENETILLKNSIPDRYENLGFVTNGELANLYNESFALFYPSEYEGFGFPVIEAQACACPVICQKKSSIPEVSGDNCVYVDSSDFEGSIEEIKKLFTPLYYEKMQKAGLENVKRFSWEKCVQETQSFYEECFNQNK